MEKTNSQTIFKRIRHNKLALFPSITIGIFILMAVFAYFIIPDNSPYANNQFLELNKLKPGSRILFFRQAKTDSNRETSLFTKLANGKVAAYTEIPIATYKIAHNKLAIVPFSKLKTYTPDTLYYPLNTLLPANFIKNASPEQIHTKISQLFVEKHFLLGTDNFGRDLLSRLILGMRVSLSVGFVAVLIALFVGVLLGSLAGYFVGKTDHFILWLINVIWSLPSLLLIIAITFALGKGFWQVFIAIGLSMWVEIARVVRGQIIAYKNLEYIEAARALGYSNFRIIWYHILPNILAPVIVISAANFASAILVEAGLSFLGLGIPPPMPSWGSMIRENYSAIFFDSAYLALLPGLAILITVLIFMLFGKGLREALNVRSY